MTVTPPPVGGLRAAQASAPSRLRPGLVRYGSAVLSAIVPGLGHVAVGRHRRAAFFLVPILVPLAILLLWAANQPIVRTAAYLADPDVLGALLIVQVAFLAWRLAAVAL